MTKYEIKIHDKGYFSLSFLYSKEKEYKSQYEAETTAEQIKKLLNKSGFNVDVEISRKV